MKNSTRQAVSTVRERLMTAADAVCLDRLRLATEAWRRYEKDPPPLRQARLFAHVLENLHLDLKTNPFFAGNTSSMPRGITLLPEYGFGFDEQVLLENDGLSEALRDAVPEKYLRFWSERVRPGRGGTSNAGHLAVDYERVVRDGLAAVLAELDACRAEGDEEARVYREAMCIALNAVLSWAGRYAQAAERAARETSDPVLRRLHERVASACRQVPAGPARNCFEGLQSIVLAHLALAIEGQGLSISIGLPDRALARFTEEARQDPETPILTAAFLLAIAANGVYGRGSKTQAVTIGGADAAGDDCGNALTSAFLEGADLARVGDPHLFLRWHPGLEEPIRRRASELLAGGLSMPLLINDPPTVRGLRSLGVSEEDAWEYCVIGCNELGIPGRLWHGALGLVGFNHLAELNHVLLAPGAAGRLTNMEAVLAAYEERLAGELAARARARVSVPSRMAAEHPMPYTTALMRGTAKCGRDYRVCGPYTHPGLYERGLANAADALCAIAELVFRERSLSLETLAGAMRDNHRDKALRARLRSVPAWGNDSPAADRWASALLEARERAQKRVAGELGLAPWQVCHVVRSLHRLDGKQLPASADGRRAGEPVGDSLGAVTDRARQGPTALLNSVARIASPRFYPGGYNLNLTLPLGETKADAVLSLIEGFFAQGGQELQIAALDAEVLKDAQRFPERHKDLLVRIAGFSAVFVQLSRAEQDELIARAAAPAGGPT